MLKTCRGGIAGIARGEWVRRALVVFLVSSAGLWLSEWPAIAPAMAQERGSVSNSVPVRSGATVGAQASDNDEGPDPASSEGGRSGPSRAEGSSSVLGGIIHASAPVVIVALIIAAMSFYLIALVFWMALNYRTLVAIPPTLVQDIQDLLDQTKYNEAYHRLVGNSSFLAGCSRPGCANFRRGCRRLSAPPSLPTNMRRWRWNIARLISPLWEHLVR